VQVSIAKLERDDAAALGRKIQAAERLFADRSARLKRTLLTDCAHDARSRATVAHGALHLLHDCLIVRGNRRDCEFRLHEHDLVPPGLEIVEQVHGGIGRRMLEIVQQDNAFAVLLQLCSTDCRTCSGLRILKSNESRSAEKMPMFRFPRYSMSSGGCRSAGNRK
jgi:hypothetical protein